jgi:hypothetical protein
MIKYKKYIVFIVVIVLAYPLLTAFISNDSMQQRWWQRKRDKQPPVEFSTLEECWWLSASDQLYQRKVAQPSFNGFLD